MCVNVRTEYKSTTETRCTILAKYYASDSSVSFKPTLIYFAIVLHMLAHTASITTKREIISNHMHTCAHDDNNSKID